ncbi:MAG: hypothetical protein JNK48_09430 [Bryobacterales bacterium]|nr:hypothetical protein [Bryobacterales bacterium]
MRAAILLLLATLASAQGPLPKLYPVDETARDPSFQAFTSRLRSAVEKRDTKALRRLTDDEVVSGPEKEDKGWKKFVERWRPDDPDTELWASLAEMLHLGFTREQPELYLSPYVVWRFPAHLSRRAHLVVAKEKAPLRESPSLDARVLAVLSFDIVRSAGEVVRSERLASYAPVETGDGMRGFVNVNDVVSPMIARGQFYFKQKRWVLAALESD